MFEHGQLVVDTREERLGSIASPQTLRLTVFRRNPSWKPEDRVECAWVLFGTGANWVPVDELVPHREWEQRHGLPTAAGVLP